MCYPIDSFIMEIIEIFVRKISSHVAGVIYVSFSVKIPCWRPKYNQAHKAKRKKYKTYFIAEFEFEFELILWSSGREISIIEWSVHLQRLQPSLATLILSYIVPIAFFFQIIASTGFRLDLAWYNMFQYDGKIVPLIGNVGIKYSMWCTAG